MLKKNYSKSGRICRVTFKYNNTENADTAVVAGEFNNWSLKHSPMKKLKNGSFSITLSLPSGNSYPFRYVLDGKIWVNDEAAHNYVPNGFGEDNSIIVV